MDAARSAPGPGDERVLRELVASGLSIAALAQQFCCSKGSVRYWLRRYGLRTIPAERRDRTRRARAEGEVVLVLTCAHHGETEFVREGSGYFRCKRCRAARVSQNRRLAKIALVAEAGGSCQLCGYDKYPGALQFHHLNPADKRLHVSNGGRTVALETLRQEARKCLLLCANCHAEVEGGVTSLPLELADNGGCVDDP
jgi:5-methylcytosine-specific restriction endonuclease McrA